MAVKVKTIDTNGHRDVVEEHKNATTLVVEDGVLLVREPAGTASTKTIAVYRPGSWESAQVV